MWRRVLPSLQRLLLPLLQLLAAHGLLLLLLQAEQLYRQQQ